MTLDIIGAGKVGQALGRLWCDAGLVTIGAVFNRSTDSAQAACNFIGAGRAVATLDKIGPSDALMLAASDRALAPLAAAIAAAGIVRPGTLVFHCSGGVPASVLEDLRAQGARVGSLHPVKSFSDPARAVASFAGTLCGLEGDADCVAWMTGLSEAIGGRPFVVDGAQKTMYHAGIVTACNFLPGLVEAGIEAFGRAGIARDLAMEILQPLVTGVAANIFALGPAAALTGPAARGDTEVVAKQEAALRAVDPTAAEIYRLLSVQAAALKARN